MLITSLISLKMQCYVQLHSAECYPTKMFMHAYYCRTQRDVYPETIDVCFEVDMQNIIILPP